MQWVRRAIGISLVCQALSAHISERFYFRADGGGVLAGTFTADNSQPELQINDLGRSWLCDVGVGYILNRDFRLELRAARRFSMRYQYFSESIGHIDLIVGKLQNSTVTLGGYYQLFQIKRSTPYIGGGIGYAHNRLYDNTRLIDLDSGRAIPLGDVEANAFCFFIAAGSWISLTPRWHLDLALSYFNLGHVGPVMARAASLDNIATFEATLGLVYRLP